MEYRFGRNDMKEGTNLSTVTLFREEHMQIVF